MRAAARCTLCGQRPVTLDALSELMLAWAKGHDWHSEIRCSERQFEYKCQTTPMCLPAPLSVRPPSILPLVEPRLQTRSLA
jgi:hypothetical protein